MAIHITQGDITYFSGDAIVNAAKESLLGGGGVDGAIHRAAGPGLLAECRLLGGCKTGQAKRTAGHLLPVKHIFHTPGPIWRGGASGETAALASCYQSCLSLARDYRCETVAFPSISTGVYRFPLGRAAEIAVHEMKMFLENNEFPKEITVVCFDPVTKAAYEHAMRME